MSPELLFANATDGLYSVAFFLLALMIIVFVHEFGHYIVGRISGIHAEVFSVGFGRVIWSRTDKHGTRWQLAAMPLGGFVKFLGDANASSANPDEAMLARLSAQERRHTIHGAPLWARAATVLAGPVFNVLLTLMVFALMVTAWGILRDDDTPMIGSVHAVPGLETTLQPGDQIVAIAGVQTPDVASFFEAVQGLAPSQSVVWSVLRDGAETEVTGPHPMAPIVGSVMSKSAAMDAGLQSGDVITAVSGTPVESFDQISPVVDAANGTPLALTIWRAGETFDLTLTPRRRDLPTADGGFETRWLIGLTSTMAVDLARTHPSALEVAQLAWDNTVAVAKSSVNGIAAIVKGQISSCNISGAITMATVVGDAAKSGWESFLGTLAVLSLGIGIMNLLPIPVLDGGHLAFHAWEAVTGRPPSARILSILTLIGLTLVLSLMAYALGNDLTCT